MASSKIVRVQAFPVMVPIRFTFAGLNHPQELGACLCEVECEDGTIGHGFTGITDELAAAAIIDEICGPALLGEDAMRNERLWDKMYWLTSPRGQTGYGPHALAAIDVALWDIKGKQLGLPIWRLLGGARERVQTYTTFGFPFLTRDELAHTSKYWLGLGHTRLKMTVAAAALAQRDRPRPPADVMAEDIRRIAAVRDAVGDAIELYVDANCSLTPHDARHLAAMMEPYQIGFFEEPITQNDVRLMADLRSHTSIPLAGGQNEGLSYRFRDLLIHQAVDILQPNVVIGGGFTQCAKVGGMAAAFNVPIDNGGGWPFHNMHLHAGLANGGMVEYHLPAVHLCSALYDGLPETQDGWMTMPEAPGLGFEPKPGVMKEYAAKRGGERKKRR